MTDFRTADPEIQLDATAPLVDEALDAIRDKAADQEPLQDLTSQVAYLRDTSRQASSGIGRSISGKLRTRVQAQPLKATLVVGLLAFLYGATR